MDDLWDKFGLPKELNVGESIAKEGQRITVQIVQKKFRKMYTVIKGIDAKELDLKDIARKLKEKFACGGTSKDGVVELQGNHLSRTKKVLIEIGFAPEQIDVLTQ